MKRRHLPCGGALAAALSLVLAAGCAQPAPTSGPPPITTPAGPSAATPSTSTPAVGIVTQQPVSAVLNTDGGYPDVYGDRIVYDERIDLDKDFDVWLFDTTTGERRRVSRSPLNDRYPKIFGDYIAYARDYNGVYLYRISTGTTRTIVSHDAQSQYLDLYGDKVAYSRLNRANHTLDCYVYDIPTGRETLIASGHRADGRAVDDRVQSIWGDNVVYVSDFQDLRVVNLVTKRSISLGAAGFSVNLDASDVRRSRPAIFERTVVYVAEVAGVDQVFTYDLASGVRTQVTRDSAPHANPAVHGNLVAFEEGTIDNPELVLCDTLQRQSRPLGVGKAMHPAIWGSRLAWDDLRHATLNGDPMDEGVNWGNPDVYTGLLGASATVPATSTTSTGPETTP